LFPDELAVQCLSKLGPCVTRVLIPQFVCPNHSSSSLCVGSLDRISLQGRKKEKEYSYSPCTLATVLNASFGKWSSCHTSRVSLFHLPSSGSGQPCVCSHLQLQLLNALARSSCHTRHHLRRRPPPPHPCRLPCQSVSVSHMANPAVLLFG
jgi:hypothetical protein